MDLKLRNKRALVTGSSRGIGRAIALSLADFEVDVAINAVSAGTVDTDALKHFPNRDELLGESRRRTPAGRLVEPQDVANTVVYLCTQYASWFRLLLHQVQLQPRFFTV